VSDSGERIVALETQMEMLLGSVSAIEADTKEIKATLTQQRGFIAGMLAVITPIWGAILYMGKELFDGFLSK
jgi:hypothetical protein